MEECKLCSKNAKSVYHYGKCPKDNVDLVEEFTAALKKTKITFNILLYKGRRGV